MSAHDKTLDFDGLVSEDDEFETDLNLFETAAIGVGALIAANGVAVCAAVAPIYTGTLVAAGGGLAYVGNRKRNDLPLNPFNKGEEAKSEPAPAPASEPAPVATAAETLKASEPVQVENHEGKPVMI